MVKSRDEPDRDPKIQPPSYRVLGFVYVSIGVLVAVNSFLYTLGILYLPVSTYSLICATQLAFNALFSFFLNSQKFTPYIINSLVLLTISSTLLVFNPESSSNNSTTANPTSKSSYMIGFISTVSAAAVYGLCLSLTQLAFRKVVKQETFKAVLEMLIYQYFVATCVIFIGLFASGDWKHLNQEMKDFKLGKLSYVMTLTWSAITWGLFSVGAVGLIFEVSALFSNSICTVGLTVIPVLATVFFHDRMDGIKVISMVLAIWGFISYIYQHYLDDIELRKKTSRMVSGSEKSDYDAK
ncbi:hypothetical protein MLD38_027610 [Melastoma candidum]|uniref:Uncharacterized protein n=1 Tax=Melastoma candidum TaxID=119954 RepID=A0ACB9P397_9MYRT|nr:hypothetical protein MLD38_027610 [Melastoma candidum]